MEDKSIFALSIEESFEKALQGKPEAYQYYARSERQWAGSQHSHVHHFLDQVKTPEDVYKALEFLNSIDWGKVYEGARLSRQYEVEDTVKQGGGFCDRCSNLVNRLVFESLIKKGERNLCWECFNHLQKMYIDDYEEWYDVCRECYKVLQRKVLHRKHPVMPFDTWHCEECVKAMEDKLRITCSLCGTETIDHVDPYVCNECYRRDPQASHVANHRGRARALGLPATLTLAQWSATVEHFNHKCAYCSKPYTLLEHYMPLSLGECGTTASNCVPACNRCNSRKGNSHPNSINKLFPTENLARIREWLQVA